MTKNNNTAVEVKPEESDLVTLDATLLLALDTPKDRAFILGIENMLITFIQNPRQETMRTGPFINRLI